MVIFEGTGLAAAGSSAAVPAVEALAGSDSRLAVVVPIVGYLLSRPKPRIQSHHAAPTSHQTGKLIRHYLAWLSVTRRSYGSFSLGRFCPCMCL